MEGSPSDYFEASKGDQRKYINQLLALVRRYSERPESTEDERLRWSQARMAAAVVARASGHMDTETFQAESGFHASWLAQAVGGVLCPQESLLTGVTDCKPPEPDKQTATPQNETRPSREHVRMAQEHAKQRLLEPPARETEAKKKLH